jgi:hypothetical protein
LINPKKSDFYLELGPATGQLRIKCLYGPKYAPVTFSGRKYFWHPLSFCQVNPSAVPDLIETALSWLKPGKHHRLLDLYCGFGLFGLQAAALGTEVWGCDAAETSIDGARLAIGPTEKSRVQFRTMVLDAKSLKGLPPVSDAKPELIVLDPPRGGTAPGVIPTLARRQPAKVVHWVCDMEVVEKEIESWRKQGYMLAKAVPVDMFAGTDNLEMMLAFIPDQYGVLGRKSTPPENPLLGNTNPRGKSSPRNSGMRENPPTGRAGSRGKPSTGYSASREDSSSREKATTRNPNSKRDASANYADSREKPSMRKSGSRGNSPTGYSPSRGKSNGENSRSQEDSPSGYSASRGKPSTGSSSYSGKSSTGSSGSRGKNLPKRGKSSRG